MGASIFAFFVLKNFSFSLDELLNEATKIHQSKELILYPGKLISDPISVTYIVRSSSYFWYKLDYLILKTFYNGINYILISARILHFKYPYSLVFLYFNICYWFWCNNFNSGNAGPR